MAADKALLAAASLLTDSARSMEHVVEKLESIAEQQAAVLDRLADRLDSLGGKAGKGGDEKENKALGGLTKGFKGLTDSLKSLGEAGGAIRDGFKALNEGLKDLVLSLKVYAKIPKDSVENLTQFLKKMSDEFSELDAKKIKEGGESLEIMSKGIALFGLTMILAAPAYAVAAVGSLIIIPIIAGYAYLFSKLGDKEVVKRVDDGAMALLHMGLGLVSFSLGLFAVKQLAGGDWGEFAKGSLIVIAGAAVFAGLFYLLGGKDFAERVERGAKALAFTGIALASIALGIWAFQALNIGAVPILMAGLAVGVVGLVLGIVGVFAEEIEEGATALFFSGIAIASVALGLWVFQKMDIGVGTILTAGLAIGIFGLLFGIAGAVAAEIGLGVLVFLGVAIAIIAVGYGMQKFKENEIGLEDIGIVSGTLVALGLVFAGAGVLSLFIGLGAGTMILAGLALTSIAHGLNVFKTVDFDEDDADKMSYVIQSIAGSFSLAGGTEGMSSLLGISIGRNNVERGIDSVMNAGAALTSIARGLTEFKKLNLGDDEDLWEDVVKVVTGIGTAFASMGSDHKAKPGLLGLIGIETTAVEMGIASVMNTGKALKSVAEGVKAFMKDTEGIDSQAFADSLKLVINGVSEAFAVVGGKSKPAGGILGMIGISDNSVEDGINAVKDVGSTLSDLAGGVKAFANLTFIDPITGKETIFTEKMFSQVSLNIMRVLTSVSSAFAVIGTGQTQDAFGGLFGAGDVPVKKGIDAVKGIGGELVDLAKGVADFAALKFTDPVTGEVTRITPEMFGTEKEPGLIRKNILAVVTAVSDVFGMIGKMGNQPGALGGLFGPGDNVVKVGIDAVKGVGAELSKIAEGVKIFAEIQNIDKTKKAIFELVTLIPAAFFVAYQKYLSLIPDEGMTKFKAFNNILSNFMGVFKEMPEGIDAKGKTLTDTFDSVAKGFSTLGTMKIDDVDKVITYMERLAKTSDPLIKLADSFEKIAKSMDKFSATFKKMDQKAVKTSDFLIQSFVAFAKVDPNALNTLTDKGKALINFIYEKGADTTPKAPATTPVPSAANNAEPGKTPVTPAKAPGTTPAGKDQTNTQLTQMMTDLTTNMAQMAGALKDIKMILTGTLTVKQI